MVRSLRFMLLCLVLCAGGASAQQRDSTTIAADTVAADSGSRMTPRKAFLRSLAIPGWGQASVQAYSRGGVFFALQTTTTYMMLRTMARLGEAKERLSRRSAAVRDSLTATGEFENEEELEAAVSAEATVDDLAGLVEARRQQRQDWITYVLVSTLASGVDAYVAAHLADFPARIDVQSPPSGGVQLQVRIPTGARR